jgi:hypothetical protein
MFPAKMLMDESADDRKGLKQTFSDNRNIVNGLCQSLRNASDYRVRILEEIKEQLRNPSIWKRG